MTVSDHGLMALGMVLEARALLKHLHTRYPKLVVAGYSMGGHMAAITAAVTPFAVGCAALATGASASDLSTSCFPGRVTSTPWGAHPICERLRASACCNSSKWRCRWVSTPGAARRRRNCGCKRDGYVFNSETEHQHWKGSALRWIPQPFLRAHNQPSRSVRLRSRSHGQTLKDVWSARSLISRCKPSSSRDCRWS